MNNVLLDKLVAIVGEDYVKTDESMASHCTFKCGGNAEIYVVPGSVEELTEVIPKCRHENWY